MSKIKIGLLFAAFMVAIAGAEAKIVLPAVFSDNMIVQQQTEMTFWGKANRNAQVRVMPGWTEQVYTTKADAEGKWSVNVRTPEAGGPYDIVFTDGKKTRLSNVLSGEVCCMERMVCQLHRFVQTIGRIIAL